MAYLGLFISALLAATLLPLSSELVLLGLLHAGYSPWALWGVASLGNTAGSAINWGLGRYLLHYQQRPWFPLQPRQLQRAQRWFQRFGVWSLLFAWLPAVGDGFTLVAGVMRVRFLLFLSLTALGKSGRYAVLLWLGA